MQQLTGSQDVFRAIADPTRRAVLVKLRHREYSMTDLAGDYAGSQPTFSKHVRVLIASGLVAQRRQGKQLMCRLNPDALTDIVGWADLFRDLWLERLNALDQFLENKHG